MREYKFIAPAAKDVEGIMYKVVEKYAKNEYYKR